MIYKIGNNYFKIETDPSLKNPNGQPLPTFKQLSESDLIGSTGTGGGNTLQGALNWLQQNNQIQVLDPSHFKVTANPSYLPGIPAVAEGSFGYVALPTTDINTYLGNPIKSIDFQNYLSSTGQTYSPTTGFSGTGRNLNQPNNGLTDIAKTVLDNMTSKGLTINPNVPITAQSVQEFLSFAGQHANSFLGQAQKEIAPYYQTQLKLAADTLGKSLGYNEQQLLQNEKNLQQKYSDTLKNIGVSAAEQGFALSGARQLNESNLAKNTQEVINQNRRQLAFNEGNTVGNFAQRYGSSNLPSVESSVAPRVLAGKSEFDLSGPSSPYYQLSPSVYSGLVGSEQFAETSAENQRASQLESLYNQQNATSRTLPV